MRALVAVAALAAALGGALACTAFGAADEAPVVAMPDAEAGTSGPDGGPAAELPGLVAHYPFDDGSGSIARDTLGHDGNVVGSAVWVPGKIGGALSFDGMTHVEVQAVDALTPKPAFTIAAWVKVDANQTAAPNPRIYVHGTAIDIKLNGRLLQLTGQVGGVSKLALVKTTVLTPDWHHIALTIDKGVAHWYVDGISLDLRTDVVQTVAPLAAGDVIDAKPGLTTIGAGAAGAGVIGLIDDLRIYDRALSLSEVRLLALP